MEVIHIILGKANPDRMNGVNKVVNELAEKQACSGLQVSVWGVTADLSHNYPERSYETRLFKKQRFPFAICPDLNKAIRSKKRPVMFHIHGGFIPLMYSIARLLHSRRMHFVFTPHGSYNTLAMRKNEWVKMLYSRLFELPMLKRATTIHVLGRSEISGLREWYPNEKTILIPYGYDLKHVPERESRDFRHFIIGYCGRIDVFTKGLDVLVSGFTEFLMVHPDSELWILGDGKELPELKKLVDSAVAKKIKFYGAVYGSKKEELLRQCDVFAHPSRNEGIPSSVLEAAGLGLPCLVSRATNLGEVVERYDAGVVIERSGNKSVYSGLCALYKRMVTDHAAALLAGNATKMVGEAFSWDKLLKQYLNMYKNAIV